MLSLFVSPPTNVGLAYTCDLEELGHYYRHYEELMAHWHRHFPTDILDVQYEDTIENLEESARRIIDFIDLPWNERCLEFYKHERHVATASAWQVRQPIYKSSIGRAGRYEQHLGPLKTALGQ